MKEQSILGSYFALDSKYEATTKTGCEKKWPRRSSACNKLVKVNVLVGEF